MNSKLGHSSIKNQVTFQPSSQDLLKKPPKNSSVAKSTTIFAVTKVRLDAQDHTYSALKPSILHPCSCQRFENTWKGYVQVATTHKPVWGCHQQLPLPAAPLP